MTTEMFPVLPDDCGIRPAGKPDECFYCHQKVGSPHSPKCVVIVRDSTYEVYLHDQLVGTWTRYDPAGWSKEDCEFHKNDSSWCSSNAFNDDAFDVTEQAREVIKNLQDCGCGSAHFMLKSRGDVVYRAK